MLYSTYTLYCSCNRIDAPYLYLNADFFKKKTLQISGKGYPNNRLYSALVVYIAIA